VNIHECKDQYIARQQVEFILINRCFDSYYLISLYWIWDKSCEQNCSGGNRMGNVQ